MKLSMLNTWLFEGLLFEGFREKKDNVSHLLSTMPKRKQEHSERVGRKLHKLGLHDEGVYCGLLHDYLERGGSIEQLRSHIADIGLPPRIVSIVQALTGVRLPDSDDNPNNPALDHLQGALPKLDEDTRNVAIIVKLSDRLDNLKKRYRKDKRISNQYGKKSRNIVKYLKSVYTGDPAMFNSLASKILKYVGR